MSLKRRDFITLTTLAAASGTMQSMQSYAAKLPKMQSSQFPTIPIPPPITVLEKEQRVAKAQKLLWENNMAALILDCGTSLQYFTGIRWGASERTMIAIIPVKGEVLYICPAFEESRLREQISIGKKIFTWEEDESPYQLTAKVLKDSGISSGVIGIEERVRFFIVDGIRKAAPHFSFVSGDCITIPCRIIKSAAEIAIMQAANSITLAAIKIGVSQLKEGMSQTQLATIIMNAQNQMGGNADFALCLFGKASSFPHGTKQPQVLKNGDIVLMDCGCQVHGYNSDVTRTIVFGANPTEKQINIWNLEKKAQAAGFAAAKIGTACEVVDAAARKVITDAGFGPGYQLPGLPHRTGHGIGMDGHEWGNMVKGNQQILQPGMCFSIEPTIAITGEMGIRFEDCVYMTEQGPQWFTQPSASIENPFG